MPSLTTPIGLVKHLAGVERNWFQHIVAGRPRTRSPATRAAATPVGRSRTSETVAGIIAAFEEACAESRRIAAGLPLDHVVSREDVDDVSLRWIYVHLIREHARHGGHADILREQIDGVAGA